MDCSVIAIVFLFFKHYILKSQSCLAAIREKSVSEGNGIKIHLSRIYKGCTKVDFQCFPLMMERSTVEKRNWWTV